MHTSLIRTTAAITAVAFLSSCANIQNDQTRTKTEGALVGTLLGAGLGAIIGNQSGNAGAGALIGAAAGGLVGLAVGTHVANQKQKYASAEAWLNACIANAEQVNANARAYNRSLRNKIASYESQIAQAKAIGDTRTLRNIKSAIVSEQRSINKQLETVDKEINVQGNVMNETGSPTLSNRITDLRSTRSSLSESQELLADLGNQIDV
ncbi:MAG: YMGG-like glycine zipper-containing protein [Roseimicrobium sp.]